MVLKIIAAAGLATVAFFMSGCTSAPGKEAVGVDGHGQWSYAKGPNGENCLFYSEGQLQSRTQAMSCDTVKP